MMTKKFIVVLFIVALVAITFSCKKSEETELKISVKDKIDGITVTDLKGLSFDKYPGQFELEDFEKQTGKKLNFSSNPVFKDQDFPAVEERLPKDVLVVPPYDEIGRYGGTLRVLARGPESSTGEVLSIRHANLVRMTDDLQTLVPDVAKDFIWNSDFTELEITLREGHRWSDGEPFTSEDILFWWEDIQLYKELVPSAKGVFVYGGEPMKLEAIDKYKIKISFAVPSPSFLLMLANSYMQPYQPKHILKQFHIKYNPDADKLAQSLGYRDWMQLFYVYFYDWKDSYHPLSGRLPTIIPTLESHVLYDETTEYRKFKANPYYHIVDTTGNQLPYIDEIYEVFVEDKEIYTLKIANGEIDHKAQSLDILDYPLLKESEDNGNYKVNLVDTGIAYSKSLAFNPTHKDPITRELFNNVKFKQAMSLAINREEINEIVYLGIGKPAQATPANPVTCTFITEEMTNYMIEYNPSKAISLLDEIGLKKNNNGFRLKSDGKLLVIYISFTSGGAPSEFIELIKEYWEAVGVKVEIKEVNTDLYTQGLKDNTHDVSVWGITGSEPPAFYDAEKTPFIPFFGGRIEIGCGLEWDTWYRSGGKEGMIPPPDVQKLYSLYEEFLEKEFGSDEYYELAGEMSEIIVKNLFLIGTTYDLQSPVVVHNRLKNVKTLKLKGYTYYYDYSIKPCQWFLN